MDICCSQLGFGGFTVVRRHDGKQRQTALERCNVVNNCWLQKIICFHDLPSFAYDHSTFFTPMTKYPSVTKVWFYQTS